MPPIVDLVMIGLVVVALSGLRVAQEYERGVTIKVNAVHDLDEILRERNKINTLLGDNISGSTAAWENLEWTMRNAADFDRSMKPTVTHSRRRIRCS